MFNSVLSNQKIINLKEIFITRGRKIPHKLAKNLEQNNINLNAKIINSQRLYGNTHTRLKLVALL